MTDALIFDIKRYAINDGPGIRMVIFLKGCNLNCAWCHNPESISPKPERLYALQKCIKCSTCVINCKEGALILSDKGVITDTQLCNLCGKCAEVCPTRAIEMSGERYTVSDLIAEIEKERIFFDQSGGGVTISGGEPLQQPGFLVKLLEQCRQRGIHTAVDTAGLASTSVLLEVAKHTDLFLFDLKMMNSDKHSQWTGVPNGKILENLKLLAETGAKIIIRIPLIGEVNDDVENLTASARFVSELAGEKKVVNLLQYHKIAQPKYEKLGRFEAFRLLNEPTPEAQIQALAIFKNFGIDASFGG